MVPYRRFLQSSFGSFYQFSECSCVENSHVSQNFAVQVDASLAQAADETAVAHAVSTGSSVDTSDPQTTEFTLLCATVTTSIAQRALRYRHKQL